VLTAAAASNNLEHVFGDVLHHLQIGNLQQLNALLLPRRVSRIFTAQINRQMSCAVHGGLCIVPECDIDNSGFPCVDWSPSGNQMGIDGPSFAILCALLAFHRAKRTRALFLENVPEFRLQVLDALAGDMWTVHPFYLQPQDCACEFFSRTRLFVMLLLKGKEGFKA
jgi:site-specific DNA-cytosine methylase